MILMELKVIKTVLSQYPVCKMCYDDDYVCSGGGGTMVWQELVVFMLDMKNTHENCWEKICKDFLFHIYIRLYCALYCVCGRRKRGAIDSTFYRFFFSPFFNMYTVIVYAWYFYEFFMLFSYICMYIYYIPLFFIFFI